MAWSQSDDPPWVLIDTRSQTLTVFSGDKTLKTFKRIALGRSGYARERLQGDGKTPLGEFHVAWINPNSRFHIFFGLDYPNQEHAELAFSQKRIDFDTYFDISKALFRGQLPPQDTPLGGDIGIHGVGNGDLRIHEAANWTDGCVALTNKEIEQLAQWVTLGTRVVISDGSQPALPQQAIEIAETRSLHP